MLHTSVLYPLYALHSLCAAFLCRTAVQHDIIPILRVRVGSFERDKIPLGPFFFLCASDTSAQGVGCLHACVVSCFCWFRLPVVPQEGVFFPQVYYHINTQLSRSCTAVVVMGSKEEWSAPRGQNDHVCVVTPSHAIRLVASVGRGPPLAGSNKAVWYRSSGIIFPEPRTQ